MCDEGEVEDVEHFYCTVMAEERKEMVRVMKETVHGGVARDGR